jgi:hypothetical protein
MNNSLFIFAPSLNSLKFINDQQLSYLERETHNQPNPVVPWHTDYYQKIQIGDLRTFQWVSDYDEHEMQVLDEDRNVIYTQTQVDEIAQYTDPKLGVTYGVFQSTIEFIPSNSIQGGYVFVRIVPKIASVPDGYIESERCDVAQEWIGTELVTVRNLENIGPVIFEQGAAFSLRVEAKKWRRTPSSTREWFRSSDGSGRTISSRALRKVLFEVYNIPPALHEQLSQFFNCSSITIDGEVFSILPG